MEPRERWRNGDREMVTERWSERDGEMERERSLGTRPGIWQTVRLRPAPINQNRGTEQSTLQIRTSHSVLTQRRQ